jgi:hypothetical protein
MVHVAQFLTSLTLNPRFIGSDATHLCSDGDDSCKVSAANFLCTFQGHPDLAMVSELGAREHGAMQAQLVDANGESSTL